MIQTTTDKIHIDYNKLIGVIDAEYYFLKYVFDGGHGLKGATGSILRPVTNDEAEERRENYDDDNERWKQAVADDYTTLGAYDYKEQNPAEDEDIFDLCDRELADNLMAILTEEYQSEKRNFDIELIESVGGGSCFKVDMRWDKLYNRNLWELIKQYES